MSRGACWGTLAGYMARGVLEGRAGARPLEARSASSCSASWITWSTRPMEARSTRRCSDARIRPLKGIRVLLLLVVTVGAVLLLVTLWECTGARFMAERVGISCSAAWITGLNGFSGRWMLPWSSLMPAAPTGDDKVLWLLMWCLMDLLAWWKIFLLGLEFTVTEPLEFEGLGEQEAWDSSETTDSIKTWGEGFDWPGFLKILGSIANLALFLDLRIFRVRLSLWLKDAVSWSKLL